MGRWVQQGQRDVFVADDDAAGQARLREQGFAPAAGETVSIVDPYGHQSVISQDQQAREQAQGIDNKVESNETVIKRAHDKRLEDKTSIAGAALRSGLGGASFGLTDNFFDPEALEADRLHHGSASAIGELAGIGGSLLLAPEEQLAKLFGIGSELSAGARELAVAGDALSAEKVAGGIGSGAMLADKGATAAERSLIRTGRTLDEASATRAGIDNLPRDLIGLDAKGLKDAAQAERDAIRAGKAAEETSLQEARVPLRSELHQDIKQLHEVLQSEAPIYKAVKGGDVAKIAGVKDASAQLAKSYSSLRSILDNPIRAAENTDLLRGPLQMRQAALETLQAKAPELRAVLGSDARAAGLVHVDEALELTRQQISRISELSRSTPVASEKLAQLASGTSGRLQAIEAAQEALKAAPEMGLLAKGAQAAAFGGVTSLAHAIPGVGVLAPFIGKVAGDSIGRTFEKLGEVAKAAGDRTKAAVGKFLDTAARAPATAAAQTAATVLRAAKYADGPEPASGALRDLYTARSAELRSQTMYDPAGNVVIRPEARQRIASRLAPVGQVNPLLADKLETITVRKVEYLSSELPRQPEVGGLQVGPDNWAPDSMAIRSWARKVRAVEDPHSVEDRLADGIITPEESAAYRSVYPERFADLQATIFKAAPTLSKTLPMKKKVALSIFTGVPCTPAMQPNVLAELQRTFITQPGGGLEAPRPQPQFSAFGSTPSKEKTAAQQVSEP